MGQAGAQARLPAPDIAGREQYNYALTSILIWRGLAASVLGSETVSTPFL
jgi:hypothetical protein